MPITSLLVPKSFYLIFSYGLYNRRNFANVGSFQEDSLAAEVAKSSKEDNLRKMIGQYWCWLPFFLEDQFSVVDERVGVSAADQLSIDSELGAVRRRRHDRHGLWEGAIGSGRGRGRGRAAGGALRAES